MTAHVAVDVECDGCGVDEEGCYGDTAADVRQVLAEAGWRSDVAADTDLCPSCVAREVVLR